MQLRQPQHCPVARLQHCPLSGHGQDLQRAPRPRGKQIHTGKSGKQERSLHRETDPNRIPLPLPGGGRGPVSRALPHTVCFLL